MPNRPDDIQRKIAHLESQRDILGDAIVDEMITKLRAQATPTSTASQQQQAGGNIMNSPQTVQHDASAQGNSSADENYGQNIGVNTGTVQQFFHTEPPDPQRERQQQAVTNYLRALRSTCRTLHLAQIDEDEAGFQNPMHLERVYISLHTLSQVKMTDTEIAEWERRDPAFRHPYRRYERPRRPLTALEALSQHHPATLMLLGAPGSGKSTLVNYLTLCLVGATLSTVQQEEPQTASGWLSRLPGWQRGTLLPIRIILREFAASSAVHYTERGSVAVLLAYLTEMLTIHDEALTVLEDNLSKGRALLLFDGLDEVVREPELLRVVETIMDARNTYTNSSILVTCRVLDYESNRRRQLVGFRVETLTGLTDDQIEAFIDAWYAEIERTERQMLGSAAGLRQAMRTRDELRDLARSPLLLTMMTIVHAGKGALPDARTLLYFECIDLLLQRWRQEPGQPDVLAKLEIDPAKFRARDLLAVMARLGFAAHQQVDQSTNVVRPADLSGALVRQILQQELAPYADGDDLRRDHLVSTLLHAIATRNGLLLKRSNEPSEIYAFPHRSFQEFLAGYALKSRSPYRRNCLTYTPSVHWHETLRLMVSYQVLQDSELERPFDLACALLNRSPIEQALACELLSTIGYERAEREGLEPADTWHRGRERLTAIVEQGQVPEQGVTLRIRAARALADLGDPRFPVTLDEWRITITQRTETFGGSNGYWCYVQPGTYCIGGWEEDKDQANITLPSFWIARYPITVAQYASFIENGGYQQQEYWTPEGWTWIQNENRTQPWGWGDSQYNSPNQAVIGVTWYEGMAFCAWLTEQLANTRYEIRLPTEAEWEAAAAHDTTMQQRRYPWGNRPEPTVEHAIFEDDQGNNLGAPAPVGVCPNGAAACGALDMGGNVWEWCQSSYKAYPWEAHKGQADFRHVAGDVPLRGGAWYYSSSSVRCGTRDWNYPIGRYVIIIGIRVLFRTVFHS